MGHQDFAMNDANNRYLASMYMTDNESIFPRGGSYVVGSSKTMTTLSYIISIYC
jgi:hypothetical protein